MTSSSRRHDSLIPLSREHQYSLMLCLRIHRGLIEGDADSNWLQMKAGHAVRFFEGELVTRSSRGDVLISCRARDVRLDGTHRRAACRTYHDKATH